MNMKVTCATCAAFCLMVAFVSGAEESPDPSTVPETHVSNLEKDGHGPLMTLLLTPGEGTSAVHHRQKRTFKKKYGGGGGGCTTCGCSTCGGGGGSWSKSTSSSSSGSWGSGKK